MITVLTSVAARPHNIPVVVDEIIKLEKRIAKVTELDDVFYLTFWLNESHLALKYVLFTFVYQILARFDDDDELTLTLRELTVFTKVVK